MPSAPRPLRKPDRGGGLRRGRGEGGLDGLPQWRWWAAPAALALGLGLGGIGDLIVSIVGAATGASTSHPPPAVTIVGNVVFDLGFVAAAVYIASLLGPLRAREFGLRRFSLVRVLWMLPLIAAAYFIGTAIYANVLGLNGREQLPSGLGSPSDTAAMIGVGIFVTVIAPIAEEFFFRGFIFGVLRSWLASRQWGPWVAALITGLLFGAAHAGSAAAKYLVPLAYLGFLLCILRWKTGSLYPGMALHSINNSLAFGIDELHWNAAKVVVMGLAALVVIGLVAGPLGWREPAASGDGGAARGGSPPAPAPVAETGSFAPPGR
ncbi:MAG TPA: CPBP family intramembrane glutamic endopeptidase [Solirubrobacteraceae bacterium]|nr:CPBP family intramembrane glutamic endopeptidase [Solirubrobacteraceae bacterium]